ncbi:hypothetical protein PtB15_9B513 [Puccinia triticina]|nr:hypothetical protein PtB15_9B513 [Puccinia triticina]
MLKIGLINRPSLISNPSNHAPLADYPHHQANHQTINSVLGQVEKVIEVIRRRKSPKAIETPQRVHFIIQYANWLDTLTENVDFF